MKAADVLATLRRLYRPPEWAFFEELRCGTGYDALSGGPMLGLEKRLDAWALALWPSRGFRPTAFEIKVSRSDFLRDRRGGDKYRRYLELCQYLYFVTPEGLVTVSETPSAAGLIWVSDDARIVKPAPERALPPLDWPFLAAICRRVCRNEVP